MLTKLRVKLWSVVMEMCKSVEVKDLFSCKTPYIKPLFEGVRYPWELLSSLRAYIDALVARGIEGFTLLKEGVLVGEGVVIHPSAVIEPPAIIGAHTELRPSAYVRGCVIVGEGCVVGNSTELKNAILLDAVQVPHYNYVGDSVLGNHAHMGAGAICSNLKADGRAVVVHGDVDYPTGLRKVGGILGDHADIGCGCVLSPGTVIGQNTSAYPLVHLRGVYPSHAIIKGTDCVVKKEDKH